MSSSEVSPVVSLPVSEPLSIAERLSNVQRALTAEDLADLLQVSRLTILRKAKRGVIPCFRIGSCVRFDPKSVAVWLRKRGVQ